MVWPLFSSFRPFNWKISVKSFNQRVWSSKTKATELLWMLWFDEKSIFYIQWRQSGVKSTSATSSPEAFWQYILGYHNFEANFQSMASRWHWLEWRYKQRPNELLWTHGNLIKKIVSWVMPDNAKKRCLARLKTLMIS